MTKHQEHISLVRNRLTRTVKYVPQVKRKGGLTPYGTFAEKMAEIAKEKNAWPWKQTVLTKGGAPKDLATALKSFAEGHKGLHEKVLNLVELTCLHYEMERELERKVAMGEAADISYSRTFGKDARDASGAPVPWHNYGGRVAASDVSMTLKPAQEAACDPELRAIQVIHDLCDTLDGAAIKRVLLWTAARHGVVLG